MFLYLLQILLPQQFRAALRHEASLAGQRVDEPLALQLVIGPLGGNDADTQILASARMLGSASPSVTCPDNMASLIWLYIWS